MAPTEPPEARKLRAALRKLGATDREINTAFLTAKVAAESADGDGEDRIILTFADLMRAILTGIMSARRKD